MRGSKRQRKKLAKRAAERAERMRQGWENMGKVFAQDAKEMMQRPGFAFRLWAPDEEYLAWENSTHPHWTRTKRA